MRRRRTKHRWIKRWVLASLALTAGLLAVVCIFLWLLLAHVPWWYRPPDVSEADYSRIRNELLESVSDFGDRLVEGQPFELTLTDRQISEWVTVRSEVWPEADEWIPEFVQGPIVVFEPSRLILAGRVDKSGWQAIASAHLTFQLAGDDITVRLAEVSCGSCPLPISIIADRLEPVLTAGGQDVDAMPDALGDVVRFFRDEGGVAYLKNGVTVDNRFHWQVSKRWFRIRDLVIERGRLRMLIEPLSP